MDGVGFHADLERMQKKGWSIEVLAWEQSCNKRMKEWAREIGIFLPLEDYHESITFTEEWHTSVRRAIPLDLTQRLLSKTE